VLRARVPVVRVGGALLEGGTLFLGGALLFVDIGPIVHESPLADPWRQEAHSVLATTTCTAGYLLLRRGRAFDENEARRLESVAA
jgi:hypothetical protein